jgi:predicted nucleotidyltransferase
VPKIDAAVLDLNRVREILRKHVPTRKIVVFGSRVTGRAKPFSDLDLAILGDVALPTATLAALADDFDESVLPFKVDLVDWATTAPTFKDVILRDAVTLQEPAHTGNESRSPGK